MKMGTSKLFKRGTQPVNIVLYIHKGMECCGRLTDVFALHINYSYCYFVSREGRNK